MYIFVNVELQKLNGACFKKKIQTKDLLFLISVFSLMKLFSLSPQGASTHVVDEQRSTAVTHYCQKIGHLSHISLHAQSIW